MKRLTKFRTEIEQLDDDDLPRLWAEVMELMLERGVVSTRNNPIADIGERVVAEHLGGKVVGSNRTGYDVEAGGRKFQVKAARVAGRTPALSPIRSKDFDALVVVLFDLRLRVLEILELDKDSVADCWKHSSYVGGYLLSVEDSQPRKASRDSCPAQMGGVSPRYARPTKWRSITSR